MILSAKGILQSSSSDIGTATNTIIMTYANTDNGYPATQYRGRWAHVKGVTALASGQFGPFNSPYVTGLTGRQLSGYPGKDIILLSGWDSDTPIVELKKSGTNAVAQIGNTGISTMYSAAIHPTLNKMVFTFYNNGPSGFGIGDYDPSTGAMSNVNIIGSMYAGAERGFEMKWTPNGKYLLMGSRYSGASSSYFSVLQYDQVANSFTQITSHAVSESSASYNFAISADGTKFVISSQASSTDYYGYVRVFTCNSEQIPSTFASDFYHGGGNIGNVNSVQISPDGNILAMSSFNMSNSLQNVVRYYYFNGSTYTPMSAPNGTIYWQPELVSDLTHVVLGWSSDGQYCYLGSRDNIYAAKRTGTYSMDNSTSGPTKIVSSNSGYSVGGQALRKSGIVL